jgi:plasmid stabilization system protein ParE
MRHRVVVTSTAEANLDDIFRFIALDNPIAADKFVTRLRAKMRSLSRMPNRCPLAPEDGLDSMTIRHLIHGRYRILFTIDANQVSIIQVRHGARLPMADD